MNIAIVGAGATGLSAALDLRAAGHDVTIFEASDRPGGLAAGFKEPHWDWHLEKFYHHWFQSDSDLLRIADEIGVRDKVIFRSPRTVGYYKGAFYPVFSPVDALLFPGVPLLAKVPWGLSAIYLRLTSNWRAFEQTTAHEWCSKWMGAPAYKGLVQPMLDGKFGSYARQVNMAWMWARVKARSFSLGTFEGGFQQFFYELANHVTKRGTNIRYGVRVRSIAEERATDTGSRVSVEFGSDRAVFDQVLVTTSPALMTQLAPTLPEAYLSKLNQLKSLGAIVAIYALDRPLGVKRDYYWYNMPKIAGFPFLCLCEHTNFAKPENFGGDHIVYCGDYLPVDHATMNLSDADVTQLYATAFRRINPDFEPTWIRKTWVFRERYAQPVPLLNHSHNIPPTRTPIDGLHFASMSHVYPWDRGTNYALQLGRSVARDMMTA